MSNKDRRNRRLDSTKDGGLSTESESDTEVKVSDKDSSMSMSEDEGNRTIIIGETEQDPDSNKSPRRTSARTNKGPVDYKSLHSGGNERKQTKEEKKKDKTAKKSEEEEKERIKSGSSTENPKEQQKPPSDKEDNTNWKDNYEKEKTRAQGITNELIVEQKKSQKMQLKIDQFKDQINQLTTENKNLKTKVKKLEDENAQLMVNNVQKRHDSKITDQQARQRIT